MKRIILRVLAIIGIVLAALIAYVVITFLRFTSVSKGELISLYDNPKSAVMVIDIQEGTTGKVSITKGLVRQADPFIRTVNQVIEKADSFQIPIVYIYHENTHWFINLASNNVLAKGTPGAAIDKRVKVVTENIFSKNKTDAFTNPALDDFLRKNQVNHLYVTGLDAAYCVNGTSRGALNRGYNVTIIRDAVISEKEEKKEKMLQKFEEAGMKIITAENWLKQ